MNKNNLEILEELFFPKNLIELEIEHPHPFNYHRKNIILRKIYKTEDGEFSHEKEMTLENSFTECAKIISNKNKEYTIQISLVVDQEKEIFYFMSKEKFDEFCLANSQIIYEYSKRIEKEKLKIYSSGLEFFLGHSFLVSKFFCCNIYRKKWRETHADT